MKLPKKRCPGGRRLHRQRPQRVFEEDEAEERGLLQTIDNTQKMDPVQHLQKKCYIFLIMTQKDQLTIISQKSFKTCLRKPTIIAPFYFLQQSFIYLFFSNRKKKISTFFNFEFFEIAPKKVPRGTPSTSSAPSTCF